MKIYYEDNHIIVVEKEPNIPTQEDESKDKDMLTLIKEYLKVTYDKPGNVFLGLVHRLDRPVGGIMVFAKTSKAASRLSDQVRKNTIDKKYTSVVLGKPKTGLYSDYLVKDRTTNTSRTCSESHPEGKLAKLTVESFVYDKEHDLSLVTINLLTGRSHQIRVQFASRNHPLWGDARYNPQAKPGQQIALWATELSFDHPTTKKRLTFKCQTPASFPFTLWNNASNDSRRISQSA